MKWQREKRVSNSFQVSISTNASLPRMKKRSSGPLSRKCRMVSMEYDFPGLESSMLEVEKDGLVAMANLTISSRWLAWITSSVALWGGMAAGMKITSSRPKASRISSAPRRWPRWIGLNVPPKSPILFSVASFLIAGPLFFFRKAPN